MENTEGLGPNLGGVAAAQAAQETPPTAPTDVTDLPKPKRTLRSAFANRNLSTITAFVPPPAKSSESAPTSAPSSAQSSESAPITVPPMPEYQMPFGYDEAVLHTALQQMLHNQVTQYIVGLSVPNSSPNQNTPLPAEGGDLAIYGSKRDNFSSGRGYQSGHPRYGNDIGHGYYPNRQNYRGGKGPRGSMDSGRRGANHGHTGVVATKTYVPAAQKPKSEDWNQLEPLPEEITPEEQSIADKPANLNEQADKWVEKTEEETVETKEIPPNEEENVICENESLPTPVLPTESEIKSDVTPNDVTPNVDLPIANEEELNPADLLINALEDILITEVGPAENSELGQYRDNAEKDFSRSTQQQQATAYRSTGAIRPVEVAGLGRKQLSAEEQRQAKYLKERENHWLASKNSDDPAIKAKKELKNLLNKLSPDNFELISQDVLDRCNKEENVDTIIEFLVKKAWTEPIYTRWYAELVRKMHEHKMPWIEEKNAENDSKGGQEVKEGASAKVFKGKVLYRLEDMYHKGFEEYHTRVDSVREDSTTSAEFRNEALLKMKMALLGNINFTCDLFQFKIISFATIKYLVIFGLSKFLQELTKTTEGQSGFSGREDYLEAVIRVFENVGQLLETRGYKPLKSKNPTEARQTKEDRLRVHEEYLNEIIEVLEGRSQLSSEQIAALFDSEKSEKRIAGISDFFFEILNVLISTTTYPISLRMQSLIDNLIEFRSSGWKVKIHIVKAAKKTKSDAPQPIAFAPAQRSAGAPPAQRSTQPPKKGQTATVQAWGDEPAPPAPQQTSTVSLEESLKNLNKLCNENRDEVELTKQYEETLCSASDSISALRDFLKTIGIGVKETTAMEPRYAAGLSFIKSNGISSDQFFKTFNGLSAELANALCDNPRLPLALAVFFYRLRCAGLIDLSNLDLAAARADAADEDAAAELEIFTEELVRDLCGTFRSKAEGERFEAELAEIEKAYKL